MTELTSQESLLLEMARVGIKGAILAAHSLGLGEFEKLSKTQLKEKAGLLKAIKTKKTKREASREVPWPWQIAELHMLAALHASGVKNITAYTKQVWPLAKILQKEAIEKGVQHETWNAPR